MAQVLLESLAPPIEAAPDPVAELKALRQKVCDTLGVEFAEGAYSLDQELKILEAIPIIESLLKKKHLSRSEMAEIRSHLKSFGRESAALDFFGPKAIRHYFELLSGSDADTPYAFVLPLADKDLDTYLIHDFAHDNPEYQTQSALDFIDDPIDGVSVNTVVSALKANPDFFLRVLNEPRLYNGTKDSYIFRYLSEVLADPNLRQGYKTLDYFFLTKPRAKLINHYNTCLEAGRRLAMAETRKKIRKMDIRFLAGLMMD